jgi:proteasome activator subunit 4
MPEQNYSIVLTVLTTFLPKRRAFLYLPALFEIWAAFNSSRVDDRMIDLLGILTEKNVAGRFGDFGPNECLERKDIGIFTELQWTRVMRACQGFMGNEFEP